MRGSYPTFRDLEQDLQKAVSSFRKIGNPLESGEFRYMDLICTLKPSPGSTQDNKIVRV